MKKTMIKEILTSWIENTSTSDTHEVFRELGYKSTKQIVKTIMVGNKN